MPLTKQQKAQYLKTHGDRCPYCQSPEIEGTSEQELDGPLFWAEVACQTCHQTWRDLYSLTGIEDPDEEDESR